MSLFVITAILIDFNRLTGKSVSFCSQQRTHPLYVRGHLLNMNRHKLLWNEKQQTSKINSNICLFISLSLRVILCVDEKKNMAANYAPVAADGVLFHSY